MSNKKIQVAVLDIGSSKITAMVSERGINGTFVIKGEKSYKYEGFCSDEIFDIDEFKQIIVDAGKFLKKIGRNGSLTVYVGVPSAFTRVIVRDSQISFEKKKKITEDDVNKLFESAFVPSSSKDVLINRSAIVYELDDYRRLASPIGAVSEILKGKLSFVLCESMFVDMVSSGLKVGGANNVEFVSSSLAEAMYLVNAETRDRIAEVLDIGHISTTFSIVQGDGIIFEKCIDYGGGYITGALMDKLGISFEQADKLKNRINLSRILQSDLDYIEDEDGKYYNVEQVNAIVKTSLDTLCESIASAIEESGFSIPEYVKLMITGGGIAYIRGAKEHISDRLNMIIEVVKPNVPLLEYPTKSSQLSLLDIAFEQNV